MAKDKSWEHISQAWLYGDHYQWRQMRANGVPERFCTGDDLVGRMVEDVCYGNAASYFGFDPRSTST